MMTEKDNIRRELEEWSPDLARMKEEPTGFTVPENYFSAMKEEVMTKVAAPAVVQEQAVSTGENWWGTLSVAIGFLLRPGYAMGAMAAVALLVVAFVWWPAPVEEAGGLAGISDAELMEYISANIDAFPLDMIVEAGDPKLMEQFFPVLPEGQKAEDMEQLLEDLLEDMDINDLDDVF